MNNEIPHLSDMEKQKRLDFASEIEKTCKNFSIKLKVSKIEESHWVPLGGIKWLDHNTLGWVDE